MMKLGLQVVVVVQGSWSAVGRPEPLAVEDVKMLLL
jgi:hypothetical protein